MPYTTVAAVLAHLGVKDAVAGDRMFDEATTAVLAADDEIDEYCGRRFGKVTAAREFRGNGRQQLPIGDVAAVTRVETRVDQNAPWMVLDATQWQLGDSNSLSRPADSIWKMPDTPMWPKAPAPVKTVRVTGAFGWPAVPPKVTKAALYWACSLVQELTVPLVDMDGAVAGSAPGEAYNSRRMAMRLLSNYRRPPVA